MNLLWKLLRRHVSLGQLGGFFLANLLGMLIVLTGLQFYKDVLPLFTAEDSFMKKDYLIVQKRPSMLGAWGKGDGFSKKEQAEMLAQPFCKSLGAFTASRYKVSAGLGLEGVAHLSTEMFFESVPDAFIDADKTDWHYTPGDGLIPIILPRSYLTLYNFGFAQSRQLPKLNEGIIGMVKMDIRLRGTDGDIGRFKGRVVGFSNRLNTILVPESFMNWSNGVYAPEVQASPTRLIMEVDNPADDMIAKYCAVHGYDIENDKLDAGKTVYFLKMTIALVMGVGLLICVLSFYILMLSVYLLVQKNTVKLQNLLLIGYTPAQVSAPYQLLTLGLNAVVLLLSLALVAWLRREYLFVLQMLYPDMEAGTMTAALFLGIGLFVGVSVINAVAIRRKVLSIWRH